MSPPTTRAILNESTSKRGYYFRVGADPTYAFANFPLAVELDENQLLATSERKNSLWQVHAGLTLVF